MQQSLAVVAVDSTPCTRRAWWLNIGAIPLLPSGGCWSGLTVGRAGLVLLICLMLTVRQLSQCVFETGCGIPEGRTAAGIVHFMARHVVLAVPMLLAVTITDNLTRRSRAWIRVPSLSGAVLLGSITYGVAFLFTQPANVLQAAAGRYGLFMLTYSSRALLYGGMATAALYLFSREREDARALHAASLEKLSLDRRIIEARLQALQAQIEPHFLFNTLANIKLLYETDASRAKGLIHDLAAYLRTALPLMRDMRSTLARELALAEAYLRVLKVRMGERLRVEIDVPADLLKLAIPPMMLLTLVENAIKHGVGPLPRGGTIAIHADRCAERLRVTVTDDGVGFPKGFGAGVGLANVRARLTALYRGNARLILDANPGGGVIAGIELPCGDSSPAAPPPEMK